MAPWIRPANDLGEDYLGGLRAGAEIAHQKAALEQQAGLHAMELSLKQQQMARENAIEQQKLEVTKAYHTQQTQLMSQRLEQAQQVANLKTQEAARRFAATQAYQKDLQGGMSPLDAIMRNFPGTDESMTGYGQLARMMQGDKKPVPPPSVENVQVGDRSIPYLKIPEANGGYRMQAVHEQGRDVQNDAMIRMRVRELERKRDKLEANITANFAQFDGMDAEAIKKLGAGGKQQYNQYLARKKAMEGLDRQIDQLYLGETGGAAGGNGAGAPEEGPTEESQASAERGNLPKGSGFKILAVDGKPRVAAPAAAPIAAAAPVDEPAAFGPGMMIGQRRPPQTQAPVSTGPGEPFMARRPDVAKPQPPPALLGPAAPLFNGQVISDKQYNDFRQQLLGLSEPELFNAAKRIGMPGVSYNDDQNKFYVRGSGFSGGKDDFIDELSTYAREQNLDPLR